jgi:hypothetical protein
MDPNPKSMRKKTMTHYTAMFVPTLLSLSTGMEPIVVTLLVDDGPEATGQLMQRTSSRVANELGMSEFAWDMKDEALLLYDRLSDETPIGSITWVATVQDAAAAG